MRTIIKNVYVLCVISILFCACKNDDDQELFNKTATKRISEREQELKNLLTSAPHGWKAIYFTNPNRFGGFTLLMDFDEKGYVKMASDIDEDTEEKTSIYDINLGNTVKLTFSTKNHIHKLNDSYVPEVLKGTGFEGDNEFSFYGANEDMITFRGVKNNVEITFEKATAEDWDNLIVQNRGMINNIISGPEDPVYQVIKITKNGKSTLYNFNYNALMRFVSSETPTDDNKLTELSFGVGFTPEGLVLNPPLEIGSDTYTDFTWDEENRTFVSRTEGSVAEIVYSNEPAYINNDYKDLGTTAYSLTYRGDLTDNALSNAMNSSVFTMLLAEINEELKKRNPIFEIDRVALIFNLAGETDPERSNLLLVRVGGFNCNYNISYTYKDKKVVFAYHGPQNDNGAYMEENLNPDLIDLICSPEGFYVSREGRFESQYTNPAYSLTSAADARFRLLMQGNYYSND